MSWTKVRAVVISVFVICWLILFHYESIRHFYLSPLLKKDLPKTKFLFPPAGWIMFYSVGDSYGTVEVFGVKEGRPQLIDPHMILQTRAIGYDNIHRNALLGVLSPQMRRPFCMFLQKKFSYFDAFLVTYAYHPNLSAQPFKREQNIVYECQ